MRIEIRNQTVTLDGYVNVVGRDSNIMLDEFGERFVEQIKPKVWRRALEKSENVDCFLNHNEEHLIGSTKQGNIELFEDNIGLRAIANITDAEVIEKAQNEKLKGWSFGFEGSKYSEEDYKNGIKRRYIEDLNLYEISIIDNTKIPAYVGTSIETRALDGEKKYKINYRTQFFTPKYYKEVFNFGEYENIIKNLK